MKQEKGVVPSSSTNITTNIAAAPSGASHPMAAEALAAQANFEVTFPSQGGQTWKKRKY